MLIAVVGALVILSVALQCPPAKLPRDFFHYGVPRLMDVDRANFLSEWALIRGRTIFRFFFSRFSSWLFGLLLRFLNLRSVSAANDFPMDIVNNIGPVEIQIPWLFLCSILAAVVIRAVLKTERLLPALIVGLLAQPLLEVHLVVDVAIFCDNRFGFHSDGI